MDLCHRINNYASSSTVGQVTLATPFRLYHQGVGVIFPDGSCEELMLRSGQWVCFLLDRRFIFQSMSISVMSFQVLLGLLFQMLAPPICTRVEEHVSSC